ncbi:acyl-CoA thioesterase II [Sphingomonas sp. SUN019]|uniref:acyl-CoA thioesterase n=1 Tax=Sphingomonas sp. SUN019 TaxID=2937788 RepID=UPI002164185C|nr:acyl-CoA thioesterase II [Sphingomonas sp. SUN019]UVO49403.1 acyl-CoA thioesterase II [Sphingomonas sp. SUN019]
MTDTPTPEALAADLIDLLDIEEIDTDLYRGRRSSNGVGRVFGGQVIAQALQAAQRSTDAPKVAHSLHAYFMRAGNEDYPIIYRVVRDFDGKSFSTRRVIAMQRGQPILNMACSLQLPEDGFTHQDTMPDVLAPESLKSEAEIRAESSAHVDERFRRQLTRPRPIEIRPVYPRQWFDPQPTAPLQHSWFRIVAPIGDDPALHRAVLSYASDMALLGTCMLPHGVNWTTPGFQTASLDHALWLHEDFRADDWLLYVTDSPWAGHARGFNRGKIFARDGRLVASVTQEGLIRLREPKEKNA